MPLESPDQQHWQAAVGYVELGMFAEADSELDKIDPFCRALPEVLAVRLAIYRGLKKWELMQQIAKRLKEFEPDNVRWTNLIRLRDAAGIFHPTQRWKFCFTHRRSFRKREQSHTISRVIIANVEK